jgi:hypothetical protein
MEAMKRKFAELQTQKLEDLENDQEEADSKAAQDLLAEYSKVADQQTRQLEAKGDANSARLQQRLARKKVLMEKKAARAAALLKSG